MFGYGAKTLKDYVVAIGGLDVGTSGCKFVLFDEDGHILYHTHRTYSEKGGDGRRELDPVEVWENVKDVIREATAVVPIEGFAIATMGESTVHVSDEGKCLCNAMVTGDYRGIPEVKRLIEAQGREYIAKITGIPPSEMYTLPKLMWLNENSEVIQNSKYIFLFEDFIGYKLTGKRVVSYSSASRTMAFDINRKEWAADLLAVAGVDVAKLSCPMPSGSVVGNVCGTIAEELGLKQDVKIIVGGHDQTCATLGSGVCNSNIAEDGLGTCEAMSIILPETNSYSHMIANDLVKVPYVIENKYLTYLVMTTCGILMNWFRDAFYKDKYEKLKAEGRNIFAELDKMVGDNPTSLLVLPQFGSAGIPHVDYNAYGLFWGMTTNTTTIEMYRALKESMGYHMLLAYETVKELGVNVENIRITGGGGASPLTAQMRADIFNVEVSMLENKEAGGLGCAILTGMALGKFTSIYEGIERTVNIEKTFYPDSAMHKCYMQQYEKYKKLYYLMRDFK